MELRDYQAACVDSIRMKLDTDSSTLFVLPTGTGKTIVFAALSRHAHKRVMVLAHRQELIRQAADKIKTVTGERCAIEMGQEWSAEHTEWNRARVVVSSVQTQISGARGEGRMSRFNPNDFDLLIIDEGHHSTSDSYKRIVAHYRKNPDLKVVGCTATPDRADEEALGQIYDSVAYDYEISDAIRDGWLVPVHQRQVFVESLDFSSVRTTAGDLNGADLAAIMEEEENLHAVADPLFALARGRRAVVFTSSVIHAQRLAEILNRHETGCAGCVHAQTRDDERAATFAALKTGAIRFLCNVGICTEGWDEPLVEVVAMARPTKSRALYAQMAGRGTRPLFPAIDGIESADARRAAIAASAKANCEIIDFVGNSGRHALVSAADILGGKFSDAAVQRVKKELATQGVELTGDVLEKLKAAEKKIADEAEEIKRRRAHVIGKAAYTTSSTNPFDVLGLTPAKPQRIERYKTVTEKQKALLEKNGIEAADMPFAQVSQLIGEIIQRGRNNQCTFKQARVLKKYGYDPNCSFAEARVIMDALAKNHWKRPAEALV
jgi:superfamily II DNA or RNA helicase